MESRREARRESRREAVELRTIELVLGIASFLFLLDAAMAGSCRAAKLCCHGRDSGCVIQKESPNAIIESPRDKPCYCDHACLKLADCCDDFKETCGVVDCLVSEWGAWSACDAGCGSGTQRRSRSVRSYEKNGGKHCPRLGQIRPCRSYDECHGGSRAPLRNRSVMLLSFPSSIEDNDVDATIENTPPEKKSRSCVAFTILRASKACGRISSSLVEGSRICVERREDDERNKKKQRKKKKDDQTGEEEEEQEERVDETLVGIGRWRVSSVRERPGSSSNSSECHGKWIGDTRRPIDCADSRCEETKARFSGIVGASTSKREAERVEGGPRSRRSVAVAPDASLGSRDVTDKNVSLSATRQIDSNDSQCEESKAGVFNIVGASTSTGGAERVEGGPKSRRSVAVAPDAFFGSRDVTDDGSVALSATRRQIRRWRRRRARRRKRSKRRGYGDAPAS